MWQNMPCMYSMVKMIAVTAVERGGIVVELQQSSEAVQRHPGVSSGVVLRPSLGPGRKKRVFSRDNVRGIVAIGSIRDS